MLKYDDGITQTRHSTPVSLTGINQQIKRFLKKIDVFKKELM